MRRRLRQVGRVLREDGVDGLARAASRYVARQYFSYTHGSAYNERGTNVFDEDWDNLVVLDACRYDAFRDHSRLPGQLESRISRGSASREFVVGNFDGRRLDDTVYVSSNAWFGKLHGQLDTRLHYYHLCERDAFDGIVTRPSTVTDAAVAHDEQFPNKRLVVHYLQPHGPYFTRDGDERFRFPTEDHGDCDPAAIREAYVQNLQLVLSEVDRLLERLRGKTVVTADHGELLGERLWPIPVRQYQHPPGIYVEELVKVPWHVVETGSRKRITAESDVTERGYDRLDDEELDDQLAALGYT